MKRNLLAVFSSVILLLVLTIITQNAFTSTGGPPAGRTGSPGDGGSTCATGCHTGMAVTPTFGWISSNVPATGYVPGQTYTITATATQSGCVKFGFQISPQSITGAYIGTMIVTDPTNTQIVSTKYIEQKSAGTVGSTNSHTWTFDWIAPATGIGTVTFYGAFNCSNNNNSSSGDHIYTSTLDIPQCSASTTVTANGPTTFCSGGSVTLDAGNGFASYLWSNSATTQTINVATGGVYSVTVTNSGGCPAVASSSTIIVNTNPSAPVITPNASTTFCEGGSVSLSATNGLTTYLWSNGETANTINVISSGNYFVTVTNVNGCSASSVSMPVTVNPLPTPTIAGSSTICSGASSTLDGGSGYTNYLWSTGETAQTISVNLAGLYAVTVTNNNGCTGEASITEVIGNVLTPTISSNGSNSICQGSSVILDAGTGFNTYNWSNGATSQVIVVGSANSYSVSVSDLNGCTGASNVVTTTMLDTPSFSVTIPLTTICPGDSISAIATSDSINTYTWNPGGFTGNPFVIIAGTTSVYSSVATNSVGCQSQINFTVNVTSAPPVPIISQNQSILSATNVGAVSWQWYYNGNPISGATNTTYDAGSQSGSYYFEVTGSAGCKTNSDEFNFVGDGIETYLEQRISIYPNPFVSEISIQGMDGIVEIELMNAQGKVLLKKVSNNKIEILNTVLLPTGLYLLKVKSERELINRIIIKN